LVSFFSLFSLLGSFFTRFSFEPRYSISFLISFTRGGLGFGSAFFGF